MGEGTGTRRIVTFRYTGTREMIVDGVSKASKKDFSKRIVNLSRDVL